MSMSNTNRNNKKTTRKNKRHVNKQKELAANEELFNEIDKMVENDKYVTSDVEDNKLIEVKKITKPIEEIQQAMNDMYEKYKTVIKTNSQFAKWDNVHKLTFFRDAGFTELIEDFPVVSELLICEGKYDSDAFSKLLEKATSEKNISGGLKTENVKKMMEEQNLKSADEIIKIADSMYKQLKDIVKTDPAFTKLEDKKKLDHFREKLNHREFMTEYPIVSRYMICMGQYSSKAFRRFLEKIRITIHPPPDKRAKGYMEDQWVRRQADYIRYLWEAYQKGHYNTSEAKWVWEDSYNKLKGEFDDFRDKYKSIEEHTKEEKKTLSASNAKDLLERLKTGLQGLNEADSNKLIESLKDKLFKRRFSNALVQLRQVRKETPPVCESKGMGPPENETAPEQKNTITMIEHVDPARMNEVPEHMRLDETTAKKLPGYLDSVREVNELDD